MKRFLKRLAILGAVIVGLGLLVVLSGIIPIGASTGHWGITNFVLHGAMRRSVATQSMNIEVPELNENDVRLGASHYASSCAGCHGAPGIARAPSVLAMLPPPPELVENSQQWETQELYYIVLHGVKYTGMPAWPAQDRTDEPWAVAAFLKQLPELSADEYQRLAYGELSNDSSSSTSTVVVSSGQAPDIKPTFDSALQDCVRCHGSDGLGDPQASDAFPRLAAFSQEYISAALQSYASGKRSSGYMQTAVNGLSDETLQQLVRYYANVEFSPPATTPNPSLNDQTVSRGEQIATSGLPAQRIAACNHCHGPDKALENPLFPPLAGQPRSYLNQQLKLWSAGERGGTDFSPVMNQVSHALEPADSAAVSAYYASLPYVRK